MPRRSFRGSMGSLGRWKNARFGTKGIELVRGCSRGKLVVYSTRPYGDARPHVDARAFARWQRRGDGRAESQPGDRSARSYRSKPILRVGDKGALSCCRSRPRAPRRAPPGPCWDRSGTRSPCALTLHATRAWVMPSRLRQLLDRGHERAGAEVRLLVVMRVAGCAAGGRCPAYGDGTARLPSTPQRPIFLRERALAGTRTDAWPGHGAYRTRPVVRSSPITTPGGRDRHGEAEAGKRRAQRQASDERRAAAPPRPRKSSHFQRRAQPARS